VIPPLYLPQSDWFLAPLAPTLESIDVLQWNQSRSMPWLQFFWRLDHGERVPCAFCAGYRAPFTPSEEVVELADDNRVHLDAEYRCLIAWGGR
jgi:hypothetical protein